MSYKTKFLLEEYIGKYGVKIIALTCTLLNKEGCKVELIPSESMSFWDAAVRVSQKNGTEKDMTSTLYFQNTFLEIFCIDRDDPLVFDPDIIDDDMKFFEKIIAVIECRIILLMGLLNGDDAEKIYNENPGMFERITAKKAEIAQVKK